VRIEIRWAAEDLGRNLIFLERAAGVLKGVICEVAKKLAEGLGPVEGTAIQKPLNFEKAQLPVCYMPCYTHGNRG